MQRGSASRFALRSLFASCGEFRREAPVPPPDSLRLRPWGRLAEKDVVDRDTCPGCCFAARPRKAHYFGAGRKRGCCGNRSPSQINLSILALIPTRATLKKCCFRAGWNSPLAVNRAVPKGRRGAGKVLAAEPMSPRPVCALVRMPAELVRSQYQRLESG